MSSKDLADILNTFAELDRIGLDMEQKLNEGLYDPNRFVYTEQIMKKERNSTGAFYFYFSTLSNFTKAYLTVIVDPNEYDTGLTMDLEIARVQNTTIPAKYLSSESSLDDVDGLLPNTGLDAFNTIRNQYKEVVCG